MAKAKNVERHDGQHGQLSKSMKARMAVPQLASSQSQKSWLNKISWPTMGSDSLVLLGFELITMIKFQ